MDPTMFLGQSDPRRPKRLAEECFIVCIGAVQRRFGKGVLLQAIRQCEPIRIPVSYNTPFEVWLTYDTHPLVGKREKWSSLEGGTARIWFSCPGCRHRVAKLYYYVFPGSTLASDLLCRRCNNLTYQSVNCGGNRWWREVVQPMKRLLREKEQLLGKRYTPRVRARLIQLDGQIRILHEQVKPKTKHRRRRLSYRPESRQRRPYRDLSLLDQ